MSLQNLISWVEEKGGRLWNLKADPSNPRCLTAIGSRPPSTKPSSCDKPVLDPKTREASNVISVPLHILLTPFQALKDPEYGSILSSHIESITLDGKSGLKDLCLSGGPIALADARVALAAMLVLERCRGSESKWAPYIDMLPSSYNDPFWWPAEDVSFIQGTRVAKAVADYAPLLPRVMSAISSVLDHENCIFLNSNSSRAREWAKTKNAALWGLSSVMSRAFVVQIPDEKAGSGEARENDNAGTLGLKMDPELDSKLESKSEVDSFNVDGNSLPKSAFRPQLALLPLIDMLDHDPQIQASWGYVPCNGSKIQGDPTALMELRIHSALESNQVVMNNYGSKTNEELAMGYGFMLLDSPECDNLNELLIQISPFSGSKPPTVQGEGGLEDLDPADLAAEAMRKVRGAQGSCLGGEMTHLLTSSHPLPDELILAAALTAMESSCYSAYLNAELGFFDRSEISGPEPIPILDLAFHNTGLPNRIHLLWNLKCQLENRIQNVMIQEKAAQQKLMIGRSGQEARSGSLQHVLIQRDETSLANHVAAVRRTYGKHVAILRRQRQKYEQAQDVHGQNLEQRKQQQKYPNEATETCSTEISKDDLPKFTSYEMDNRVDKAEIAEYEIQDALLPVNVVNGQRFVIWRVLDAIDRAVRHQLAMSQHETEGLSYGEGSMDPFFKAMANANTNANSTVDDSAPCFATSMSTSGCLWGSDPKELKEKLTRHCYDFFVSLNSSSLPPSSSSSLSLPCTTTLVMDQLLRDFPGSCTTQLVLNRASTKFLAPGDGGGGGGGGGVVPISRIEAGHGEGEKGRNDVKGSPKPRNHRSQKVWTMLDKLLPLHLAMEVIEEAEEKLVMARRAYSGRGYRNESDEEGNEEGEEEEDEEEEEEEDEEEEKEEKDEEKEEKEEQEEEEKTKEEEKRGEEKTKRKESGSKDESQVLDPNLVAACDLWAQEVLKCSAFPVSSPEPITILDPLQISLGSEMQRGSEKVIWCIAPDLWRMGAKLVSPSLSYPLQHLVNARLATAEVLHVESKFTHRQSKGSDPRSNSATSLIGGGGNSNRIQRRDVDWVDSTLRNRGPRGLYDAFLNLLDSESEEGLNGGGDGHGRDKNTAIEENTTNTTNTAILPDKQSQKEDLETTQQIHGVNDKNASTKRNDVAAAIAAGGALEQIVVSYLADSSKGIKSKAGGAISPDGSNKGISHYSSKTPGPVSSLLLSKARSTIRRMSLHYGLNLGVIGPAPDDPFLELKNALLGVLGLGSTQYLFAPGDSSSYFLREAEGTGEAESRTDETRALSPSSSPSPSPSSSPTSSPTPLSPVSFAYRHWASLITALTIALAVSDSSNPPEGVDDGIAKAPMDSPLPSPTQTHPTPRPPYVTPSPIDRRIERLFKTRFEREAVQNLLAAAAAVEVPELRKVLSFFLSTSDVCAAIMDTAKQIGKVEGGRRGTEGGGDIGGGGDTSTERKERVVLLPYMSEAVAAVWKDVFGKVVAVGGEASNGFSSLRCASGTARNYLKSLLLTHWKMASQSAKRILNLLDDLSADKDDNDGNTVTASTYNNLKLANDSSTFLSAAINVLNVKDVLYGLLVHVAIRLEILKSWREILEEMEREAGKGEGKKQDKGGKKKRREEEKKGVINKGMENQDDMKKTKKKKLK